MMFEAVLQIVVGTLVTLAILWRSGRLRGLEAHMSLSAQSLVLRLALPGLEACFGLGLAFQLIPASAGGHLERGAALVAVRQRFPERFVDPETLVFGDFDGDGHADFAAFLGDPRSNHPDRILRAVLFRATGAGQFKFLASTLDLPSGGNVTQTLETKNGMVSIDRGGSTGCCHVWREILKFRWRGDRLWLVGVDASNLASDGPHDDSGSSVNTVTGEVHVWSLKDHHRVERRSRMAPRVVDFAGFDYERVMADLERLP
jgi:hypothetical protein